MKKLLVVSIAIFSIYCFFVNSDVNKGMRHEFSELKDEVSEEINKSVTEDNSVGSGGGQTKEFSPESQTQSCLQPVKANCFLYILKRWFKLSILYVYF